MSESSKANILVPTDFSEASEKAIEFGIAFAKSLDMDLALLHLTPELPGAGSSAQLMTGGFLYRNIQKQLKTLAEDVAEKSGIEVIPVLKEGNIFDHIGRAGEELGSKLMVMATHGVHGVQHFTGSFAAKVIQNAPVPALVVQKDSKVENVANIVVPVIDGKYPEQSLEWACWLAKAFNATVHYWAARESEQAREKASKLTEYFSEKGVKHHIEFNPAASNNQSDEIISYAEGLGASIILVNQEPDGDIHVIGKEAQEIVMNKAEIPTLCMNSKGNLLP